MLISRKVVSDSDLISNRSYGIAVPRFQVLLLGFRKPLDLRGAAKYRPLWDPILPENGTPAPGNGPLSKQRKYCGGTSPTV
jgi:hypothetical protein